METNPLLPSEPEEGNLLARVGTALRDPTFWNEDIGQRLQFNMSDVNRGLVAGTLGAPVDIANALLLQSGGSEPVGGSEWIGNKLEGAGIVGPRTPGSLPREAAVGMLDPLTGIAKGAKLGAVLGSIASGMKTADPIGAKVEALTPFIISKESSGNAKAIGPTTKSGEHATGLMQLMPGTAEEVAAKLKLKYTPDMLMDPVVNQKLGKEYFRQQLEKYDGNETLSLAAYNAGPGNVDKWIKELGDPRLNEISDAAFAQKIPFKETRDYVTKITGNARKAGALPPSPTSEQPVYSALTDSVLRSKDTPKIGTSEQWTQWLDGAQRRGLVKQEERVDSGLDEWLSSQKGPVTRQQIQDHMHENALQVSVVNPRGGADEHAINEVSQDMYHEAILDLPNDAALWKRVFENHPKSPAYDSFKSADERASWIDDMEDGADDTFVLPLKEWAYDAAREGAVDALGSEPRYSTYQLPGGTNYQERVITIPTGPDLLVPSALSGGRRMVAKSPETAAKIYSSPHWGEPNVIAHIRTNDREVAGKPALHIEEIQSDWHQAGREQGYKGRKADDYKAQWYPGQGWQITDKKGKDVGVMSARDKINGKDPSSVPSRETIQGWLDADTVPDAPHKKTWPLLALKEAIHRAVVEGKERVSFTPGQVHIDRYPRLSKEQQSGMKKFYDEILPQLVKDYVKKYGSKVETGHTEFAPEGYNRPGWRQRGIDPDSVKLYYFDITPELRKAALRGQPSH